MRAGRNTRGYEQRLRAVGGHLDRGGYHSVTILEVDGGLVIRANAPGSRTPKVLEIVDGDDPPAPSASAGSQRVPHRLFPGGYRPFLTALGKRLDLSRAAAISIVEGTDFVTVGGIKPVAEQEDGITYEPLDILLLAEDIEAISSVPDDNPTGEQEPSAPDVADGPEPATRGNTGLTGRLTSTIESVLRMAQASHHTARSRG